MTTAPRILALFAHPDDECYCAGGTLAKYAQAGSETMVISATRGQAGEIHDARKATRQTLGRVREQELCEACAELGVQHVVCWDYMDGRLMMADRQQLVGDVVQVIRSFRPDIVITFGEDGAYGHPDHVAIGQATHEAFFLAGQPDAYPEQVTGDVTAFQPGRLYFAHFPERDVLLMEEISKWLTSHRERFSGTFEFAHGLSLFVRESAMLRYSTDFVDVRWYPPDFYILEQGEPSKELFVVLSGSALVRQSQPDGTSEEIRTLMTGDFFGEMGVISGQPRSADIITLESVTCMVFSPSERLNYAGRGEGAVVDDTAQTDRRIMTGDATHIIDVRDFVEPKTSAISKHRTQTPIEPEMFPLQMLERLFGYEFFLCAYPPPKLVTEL